MVPAAESNCLSWTPLTKLYASGVFVILTLNYYCWTVFLYDSGQPEKKGPEHSASHIVVNINDNTDEWITDESFNLRFGFFPPFHCYFAFPYLSSLLSYNKVYWRENFLLEIKKYNLKKGQRTRMSMPAPAPYTRIFLSKTNTSFASLLFATPAV